MQVILTTCGAWHLPRTAKAFENRGALAGLWISEKNSSGVASDLYHRCVPFHAALKPFFWGPQIFVERAFYALFPIWKHWVKNQRFPKAEVVHAIAGYATEPFDWAEANGALKVVECTNSHPVTFYGIWQRECDLWCPGERVPIPQWMFARMNRELERADLIIALSTFCKESMVSNGIPAGKILVNPLGVDTSRFTKRPRVPEKIRFINVGTICLRKGHQYLFRAFQSVQKVIPNAELICVGGWKEDFRKEMPKWAGSFTHYPHLNHPELSKLLQTCTAFVFPSQEEGIARAQVEALASGLPLIATHQSGATTLVRDGQEGFIVNGRDPASIADAMIRVADPAVNERMSEAAYRAGAVKNDWQDCGDRLLAEFDRRLTQ